MNNGGQTLGITIMVAIMIFICGMIFVNFITGEVTRARDSSNLDCSNSGAISDGTKLTCLIVDIVVPYFFIVVLSVTGGLLIARFLS